MSTTELSKNVKITENTHQKLTHIKLEIFGADSMYEVSFSEVIEMLADKELAGGSDDE